MKEFFHLQFLLNFVKVTSLIFLLTQCSQEDEKIQPELVPLDETLIFEEEVEAPMSEIALISPEDLSMEATEDITSIERFYPEGLEKNATRKSGFGVTEFIHFRDYAALSLMPNKAHNYTENPFYIEKIGNAWIHVKENNTGNYKPSFKSFDGHYHLPYEHEPLASYANYSSETPCVILQDGNCYEFDPALFDRRLVSHDSNQWIKIYAYDQNNDARVFDLLKIKVISGPIQLWYKKSNGKWRKFKSIGENTWNLSAKCTSITEVLISGTEGLSGTFSIDNLKIRVPNN